ncbi:MAG: hypothetical protein AAFO79_12120, partial [Pseudomonadota bacterium]
LRACGLSEVVVVDLSRPEFPDIAVCKVIVPGLEPPHEDAGYRAGERVTTRLMHLQNTERVVPAPRKARGAAGTAAWSRADDNACAAVSPVSQTVPLEAERREKTPHSDVEHAS